MVNRATEPTSSSRRPTICKLAGAFAAFSTAVAAHGQTVLYVDDDAPPGGNGRSWGGAFNDLQDALWLATFIWEETEIRIAEGIYTPDRGTGIQDASFEIDHSGSFSSGSTLGFGISLKGAFAGIRALDPSERDTERFKSILSGDLNGDDQRGFGRIEDNSYHIFQLNEPIYSRVELDGLVFQGGNALGSPTGDVGGALRISLRQSAAMPVFINGCDFLDNRARNGGAFSLGNRASPISVSRCFFGNNRAENTGGAIANNYGVTIVSNCVFSGNTSEREGGAIYNEGEFQVYESTLYGNSSAFRGGALGATGREFDVFNSILFANGPEPIYPVSRVAVFFSNIEGGFAGTGSGNINAEPLFTNPLGDDEILGTPDDNFLPRFGSPVIDAGSNSLVLDPRGVDFAGRRRMVDDRFTPDTGQGIAPVVDMGAYEFQLPDCYADLDQSTGVGVLDLFDFLRFQQLFVMNDTLACQVDRSTGSNICDIFDFLAFQSEFTAGCP